MNVILKLLKFWFFLLAAAIGVYLVMYNQESIYVHLKGIGEFKVMAGLAYFAAFLLGCLTVTLYIITDIFKKSYQIHALSKKARNLERDLSARDTNTNPSINTRTEVAAKTTKPDVALESHH